MILPRPARPTVLIADLRAFLASRERHQLVFAAIAVMMPVLIGIGFAIDSKFERPPPPIIYVDSWPATRTDAEIIAQQKIDGAIKAAAMEKRRQEYERLARSLGMKD